MPKKGIFGVATAKSNELAESDECLLLMSPARLPQRYVIVSK